MAGRGGVVATAKAVALNVTVTAPQSSGFVTAYPCGQTRPTTSNLNFVAGQSVANLVVLQLPASGKVCLYTDDATHLVADVNGYFSKDSDFEPMAPRRLVDTRTAVSPAIKVPAGSTLTVPVTGRVGIPDDAAAVSLNVTAVGASANGFVTVFPCGTPRPTASTLNYVTGQTVPNAVLAKAGSGGNVCIYTQAAAHLLVDVSGWFPAGTDFRSFAPERLLDTRSGLGHSPAGLLPAGQVVELEVIGVGSSNIPAEAGAVVLNVTAANAQASGFVTVYPCGEARPTASNVNYKTGGTIANAVIAKVGAGGKVCLYTESSTNLVVDVNGWFPRT